MKANSSDVTGVIDKRFPFWRTRMPASSGYSRMAPIERVAHLTSDGGGLEIGFNNKYLMDALKAAPADKVRLELTTGVSPCVILPTEGEENFLYMVLPVRLKAGE